MPNKNWLPDTWPTLCGALGKDKEVKAWVWSRDNKFFTLVRLGEFITKIYYGVLKASLADPREKKADPRDYIGKYGVFWNDDKNRVWFGKLDDTFSNYYVSHNDGAALHNFMPCSSVPTNPDDWPKDALIFTKEDL